jgi:hypothetical protein
MVPHHCYQGSLDGVGLVVVVVVVVGLCLVEASCCCLVHLVEDHLVQDAVAAVEQRWAPDKEESQARWVSGVP